jgi:valyl-tRNA synthetase
LWDEAADPAQQKGTRRTLIRVLEATLRLLHPLMPFITEEIWQRVAPLTARVGDTIMLQNYPQADETRIDVDAEADIAWLKLVILGVRNIRGEMNISPAQEMPLLLRNGDAEDRRRSAANAAFLKKLAKIASIDWLEADSVAPLSSIQLVGRMELLVPMAGLIDKNAELARLNKGIDKLSNELERLESKLGNSDFTARAPAEVVTKEREKCVALQTALVQLKNQQQAIAAL